MKYQSNCVYIDKRGSINELNSAVDGINKLLKNKSGIVVIEIKVKRREALYMYINQILLGIEANISKFKAYIPENIDFINYVGNILNSNIIDMTEEYRYKTKDKNTIGYYKVELSIENFIF